MILFFRSLALVVAILPLITASPSWSQAVLIHQMGDGQANWGPSQKSQDPAFPVVNAEVADDIDMVGSITSVRTPGYNGSIANPAVVSSRFHGVFIRFYAYNADGSPGALQREYWLPKSDPRLLIDFPDRVDSFTATLEPAFQASGRLVSSRRST